jgi:death on curing protein
MEYLTLDELLDLHTFAIQRFGGRLGIKSQDQLQSAINAPRQTAFGEELYPDLASKVAVIGFQILKNRPFVAGNEATALLAMLRMIELNGAALDSGEVPALADELSAVLRSERDRDGLSAWLRDRLAPEMTRSRDDS